MMNSSNVDLFMIDTKRDVLSMAMGFSNVAFNDNAVSFFDKFKKSGYQEAFEQGDGIVTFGCSGAELALMINSRLGQNHQAAEFRDKVDFFDVVRPMEHWIGHALGYLQGRSGWTFVQIFEKLPLENWYNMYILHEVGEQALWDKTLGRYAES